MEWYFERQERRTAKKKKETKSRGIAHRMPHAVRAAFAQPI
jgi:hypothetical protein